MSTIHSSNSLTNSAAASLLRDAASASTNISTIAHNFSAINTTASNSRASSRNTKDVVDLSDRAKNVLARAKAEKAAADKLDVQLQALETPNGRATARIPKSDTAAKLFDQLTGRTSLQQTNKLSDNYISRGEYLETLNNAHRRPDGTVENFTEIKHDFLTLSTQEDIEQFYESQEEFKRQYALINPEYIAEDSTGFYQAIQDRAVSFLNAKDIPDLNFHNTVIFDHNELGGSVNSTYSYNYNSAIFNDPTTNYIVSSNGDVIAWKKPPATETPPKFIVTSSGIVPVASTASDLDAGYQA